MHEKIKRITFLECSLAILFLFAPFYYHHNIGGEGLRIPNNISVWMIANVIAFFSMYKVSRMRELVIPKYLILLLGFPICVTLSGFVTGVENPVAWLFRLLFIWIGMLFFLSLFQYRLSSGQVDKILFLFVISALIQGLVGVYQIMFIHAPLSFIPGFGDHAPLPYGFFQQINNQASYQVTAILVGLFLITRPFISTGKFWKKSVIFALLFLSLFILSYSGQRVGPLMLLVSLPILVVSRRSHLFKQKKIVLLSIVMMLLGLLAGSSGINKFIDKSVNTVEGGYSSNERLGIYAVSAELIREKPVFGHGLGSFQQVWQYQKAEFYKQNSDIHLISQYVTHPHNEILFWSVEGGMIAVLGLLLSAGGLLFAAIQSVTSRGYSYLALMTPIVIHTQVELPFYTSAIHWFVFLLLAFMLCRSSSRTIEFSLSRSATLTLKVLSLGMIFIGTYFLINSDIANRELSDKKLSVWTMPTAETNLYFSDLAESVQIKSLFLTNHKKLINGKSADLDAIKTFIHWAEDKIKRQPSDQLFLYLALAYQDINEQEKMCHYIENGFAIYPNDESFISGMSFCLR